MIVVGLPTVMTLQPPAKPYLHDAALTRWCLKKRSVVSYRIVSYRRTVWDDIATAAVWMKHKSSTVQLAFLPPLQAPCRQSCSN